MTAPIEIIPYPDLRPSAGYVNGYMAETIEEAAAEFQKKFGYWPRVAYEHRTNLGNRGMITWYFKVEEGGDIEKSQ